MLFSYRWFACKMILVMAGIWWCVEIWNRRHQDLAVLRESKDVVERGVVIGFWLSALVVAALLATFGVATLAEFVTRLADIAR